MEPLLTRSNRHGTHLFNFGGPGCEVLLPVLSSLCCSLHLPLYCEVIARMASAVTERDRGEGEKDGTEAGEGWDFQSLRGR
jgi:hypothetical protein